MGLDVNLYAEGEITDDEMERANSFLRARCDLAADWDKTGWVLARDEADEDHPLPLVTLKTLTRFYGEGYERGPWPNIYGAIRLMQTAFPGCRVFYGSDSSDDGIECTEDYLAALWAWFLGPNGDDYRESARQWNAAKP